MTWLLDTNVLSEIRRAIAGRGEQRVLAWARGQPRRTQFLSVVSLLELERGALLVGRRDLATGVRLQSWLDNQVVPAFAGRVLAVDEAVAQRCARLHVPDPRPAHDALIAATALVHGLTVVTRNAADFAPMGVPLFNPWED